MFREMRNKEKQLSMEECLQLMEKEPRGILSVLGDNDYPYGVPIDHWYDKDNGCIYFHGGPAGHKLDAIRKHDKVSYCIMDSGYKEEGDWAYNFKSVIIFGRIRFIDDQDEAIEIIRKLSYKYTSDTAFIEREIQESSRNLVCFTLVPEHITGKIIKEA